MMSIIFLLWASSLTEMSSSSCNWTIGVIPHIQVHDELDISVATPAHAEEIKEMMEQAVSLEIPNKVDYESGPNWGTIE